MTLETMQAVTDELVRRGVPATLEYPGFICVRVGAVHLNFGDANDTIDGDVVVNDEVIEVIESTLPRDSADVQAIANHIACSYTEADNLRKAVLNA